MKNEVERLLSGRGLKTESNKNLTQNLRQWRQDRNITNVNTKVFIENIIEELLEIYFDDKELIKTKKNLIMTNFFLKRNPINESNTLDAIQDIQVFCINETELMGYDNLKCNDEVFKEINSRRQDPMQYMEWDEFGANGKWQKWKEQPVETLYKANYESCKL